MDQDVHIFTALALLENKILVGCQFDASYSLMHLIRLPFSK